MQIDYKNIEGKPSAEILRGIVTLYQKIFGVEKTEKVLSRYNSKENLYTAIAVFDNQIIGFKTGYPIENGVFYSWLGGVEEQFRGQGIAVTLMQMQHNWCCEKGYAAIQTKTLNRWRSMLILNIKQGFDIIETYTDTEGVVKIILEKKL